MKTTRLNIAIKTIFPGMVAAMLVFALGSCSNKVAFETSPVVPAARGSVKVKKDGNHNYTIQIKLDNLAEVKRLEPPAHTYVVWMVTDQGITKNIGQINSSSSFLSKRLKATFETVSNVKPVKIFITAEMDGNIQSPGTEVLTTGNF